jgi:hypothetical protein
MESATESRPPTGVPRDVAARVKRWCKRPPAPAETRAARQAPPGATPNGAMTRPAELQVGGMSRPATAGVDGWLSPTESRLQIGYRKALFCRAFPFDEQRWASPGHHENGAKLVVSVAGIRGKPMVERRAACHWLARRVSIKTFAYASRRQADSRMYFSRSSSVVRPPHRGGRHRGGESRDTGESAQSWSVMRVRTGPMSMRPGALRRPAARW